MANQGKPAAGFKFNTFQEIKSHSSILFNERMAILFYLLDLRSIELNTYGHVDEIMRVRALIKQIYKNMRTLIRNNPTVRATLDLETKDPGIYITDLAIGLIDRMVEYCNIHGYTERKITIMIDELNRIEMLLKDILQYFHYFIRPEFRQKPDLELATEKYQEIADKKTVEELRSVVGKNNKIDFEHLGTSRIEINQELIDDDEILVDGTKEQKVIDNNEEDDEDEENNEGGIL